MMKYYYDLHIHSCLSPCGDDDNTPNNIAGMAKLCGQQIIALTDHNSSKNCPAFFEAARKYGLIPIAGMELTTAEDIHVVCLFERLSDAMSFDKFIDENRIKIKNKPEIFGNQLVLNENDEIVSSVDNLLINATSVSINEVQELVKGYGGICYPAHIDRDTNGIIAILGTIPDEPKFAFYELRDSENIDEYSSRYNIPKERFIIDSDAHYLTDMRDFENYFEISDELSTEDEIRSEIFKILREANE